MILPLGATSLDSAYQLPGFYGVGYGYGGRIATRPPLLTAAPATKTEIRDVVTLSPAAQRLMDQAERLKHYSRMLEGQS